MADSKAKRARATARIQVSKIGNFLANEASTASSSKLSVKLEILEKYYTAFHAAHAEIESIAKEEDIDGEMETCEQFDDLYCELKAALLDFIDKTKPKSNDSSSNITSSNDQGHGQDRYYKLPTLNIPKFKGSYLEWTSFRDMFTSMVDSQTRMSNIDKLCFLKTLLEGEALDLIKTLKVTSANYEEAWNALNNRYSNKALIVKSHLSELFSLENCNGTVASLKVVLDTTTANVCALENLGLESSSLSDAILYHIVISKLDQRTKESYNEHNPDPTIDSTETSPPSSEPKVCTITQLTTNQVLLATAQLHMKDAFGQNQVVRAFLDPGAQANLITKRLANRLKLAVKSVPLTITVATNLQRKSHQIVECEISSRVTDFQAKIHAAVVPEICSKLPSQRVSTEKLPLTGKILADPDFDKPAEVDLLLCGEHYLDLFTEGHVPETAETPSMRNTVLGWIIGGKSVIATGSENAHELLVNHCSISAALERFWAVEDTETSLNSPTLEGKACEKHFRENVTRLTDGRFEVAIPFKADPSLLGESRDTAVRILKHTQWRLSAEQRVEYAAFMDEYYKLGHMVKIPNDNVDLTIPHAYIPHHPVMKTASKTTKVRAVFNGAKPTSSGVSVNDIQMKGPTKQKPLFCILIGFRFRKVGVCCDVEKMYRQVKVRKQDQDIQRIVWYDKEGNICDFWLTTVTYGFTSSSFLAIECLMYLAEEERHHFPLAAAALEEDFHVDDGITGAESAAKARELIRQLNGLTAKGQFTLRKWASNDPSVLQGVESHNPNVEFLINSDEKVGTLGISWLPAQDKFVLAVTLSDTPDFNKRSILSEIAKIFDPLGLITPVVITFKLFLRELWKQGCNWDEPLEPKLCEKWQLYRKSILSLRIECPRLVLPGTATTYEIHGFCDASKDAYCACIYIRCCNSGHYNVELLCSKSRVAPLKEHHIHRLELMGAVLLATLLSKVKVTRIAPPTATYLWCDSQVALAWIRKDPSILKPFVGNRVQQIQALTSIQAWHYVNTHENPADMGSRGVTGDKLCSSSLWWNGPSFLREEVLPINLATESEPPETAQEFKQPKVKIFVANIAQEFNLFQRYESVLKLIRAIAWWRRFMANLRIPNDADRLKTSLQARELTAAKFVLVRLAQRDDFDVEKLQRKGIASKKSKLRPLAPFVDENGVIRVGGRLQNANLTRNQRHPMILSSTHPFAEALVREQHKLWCHPPHNLALAILRQEYWIIGAKRLVKKIANNCLTCKKDRAKFVTQQMGQLPPDRVNTCFPFQNVGLDYGGPIEIAVNGTRRRTTQKAYICLFVCLATKAIHIEAVTSLTSQAFLDALARFSARRGKPSLIRSDNGTNFRGAYNELIRIIRSDSVQNQVANEGISWEFIPPAAPHCGGIWEAGIKSVKSFLTKFSDGKFDYEEFSTILTKIEGFLNSRPLIPLSDDPHDLEALTPGHFLIGRPLSALPERDQTESRDNRSRFIMRQRLVQQFWRDWQLDYLNQMQQRPKWQTPRPNLSEGQLVLLREVSAPQSWLLGRVIEVYPGADGLVRVADVKTKNGVVKRHVAKLVAL